MSNEISNERLEEVARKLFFFKQKTAYEIAKELLVLRKAFSVPDCWEIAGQIFATEEEALSCGFIGKPEPLYSKPED